MDMLLNILPLVSAVLTFLLFFVISKNYHPGKSLQRTYIRVNNSLKETKSGLFNYEETQRFLSANGAAYHFGKWIDPIKYLVLRFLVAAAFFILGISYHPMLGVICMVLGFIAPHIMIIYLNNQDNVKMVSKIQTLYNLLQVQIKSGIYVTDAITESYKSFEKGRLRDALKELSIELYLKGSFETAIDNFNAKFNNTAIEALCIILKQAQESGKAAELLQDMHKQMDDMRYAMQLKRKEKLERVVTFCQLGILASGLGIVLYAFICGMYSTANFL